MDINLATGSWLLVVNFAQLVAVLAIGYRVLSFINLIQFRVEVMWKDFEHRTEYNGINRRQVKG